MFGKRRQIKDLKTQLIATRVLFGTIFHKLPPEKQRLAMANNPRDLAMCVSRAVAAGDAVEARSMLDAAARDVPASVTAEQWANIMQHGYTALA